MVTLEGLGGQSYTFDIHTPDESAARGLRMDASAGALATIRGTTAGGVGRGVDVTFPVAVPNADGYTTATLTFTRGARP